MPSNNNNNNGKNPVILAAAAAIAVSATLVWYRRTLQRLRQSQTFSPDYKIPAALLQSSYAEELKLAVQLALQAGSNMVGYCNAKGTHAETHYDLGIATKTGEEDFYTQIDVQNEQLIMDGIRSTFPSHEIIGEESTGTGVIPPISDTTKTWIVDPIDGTTNFASGLCLTCVSIALCDNKKNKRPVMGVIYAPMTQELYLAVDGCGAFRNGISVSKKSSSTSAACTELKKAVVCCEFGYSRDLQAIAKMVGAVEKVLQNGCRTLRQLGSGCLDLCYVATGRLDVVYAGVSSEGWKPWDYAAGLVIVKEAGCVMEAIDQSPATGDFDLYSKSVICAVTQELLEDCRKVITS